MNGGVLAFAIGLSLLASLGFGLLPALRAGALEAKGVFGMVSREAGLVFNNLLLAVSCFVVFIGTIWPLVAEMFFDRTLSVGPPFFNAAFNPFVIAAALALPVGALLSWKRAKLGRVFRALIPAAVLGLAAFALTFAMVSGRSALGPVMIGLSAWLVAGAAIDLWQRTGRGGIANRLSRLTRLPGADWGKAVAHAGVGITIFGVAALVTFETEDIRVAQIGERYAVGAWDVELLDVSEVQGPNYRSTMATVRLTRDGEPVAMLRPERRFYPVAGMPTTEAAIANGIFRDLYVVIGDPQDNGGWALRVWVKPFANWIWGGAIIMALGGAISLADRRYRVAAGAARAASVPAE